MDDLKEYTKRFSTYWVWVFREYLKQNCLSKGSALALSSLFAMVPLLIVAFSILSMLPAFKGLQIEFQHFILQNLVPSSSIAVNDYLQTFIQNRVGLPVTAIIVLFFVSIAMMRSLENVLNDIWHVKRKRPLMQAVLLYWAVLTLGPLLVGASLGLSSYVLSWQWFSQGFIDMIPWVKLLSFLFNLAAFSFIYKVVPFANVRLSHAILGGAFMAVLFELAKSVFAWYVLYLPSYEMLYGTLAIIPFFILWVSIAWQMLLLGAVVVNALSLTHRQKKNQHVQQFDLALYILQSLYALQKEKQACSLSQMAKRISQAELSELQHVLVKLEKNGYVQQSIAQKYFLSCDLKTEKLSRLYGALGCYIDLNHSDFDGLTRFKHQISQLMQVSLNEIIK